MKQLTVTYGSKENPSTVIVELPGESKHERITPRMAKRAARIACGHVNGVTVMDTYFGYRLYSEKRNSHRKVFREVS